MSAPRNIPDAVTARQIQASDPAVSAWVSANAGSGKTFVLAQRVIRLLLEGTDPRRILCLTYTKAAAANMANRVFERLARWTTLDDEKLDTEIRLTGVRQVDAKRRARARKLFAEALETPGGLKVQTIHAFCTRLLQQFPFEADVAARFQVLEETQQKQMLEDIRMEVLLAAAANARRRRRPRACRHHHVDERFCVPAGIGRGHRVSIARSPNGSTRPTASKEPWRSCRTRSGSAPRKQSRASNASSSTRR